MTYTLLLLAYVANVFLNRWLNKVAYKRDNHSPITYYGWFIPIIPAIVLLIAIANTITLSDLIKFKSWFTGKHW